MNSDYFEYINFNNSDLIKEIKDHVEIVDKNNGFWISKMGQCRIDFPFDLRRKLRDIMPFQIIDCGCFKNVPGWVYPIHRDARRTFAMNMMISVINSEFEVLCYNDDKTENFPIEYLQDQWVLLNTKKFHSVKNNSMINRYVISIGCETTSYASIHELFRAADNIGKRSTLLDYSKE
jgi:hypothetical protein